MTIAGGCEGIAAWVVAITTGDVAAGKLDVTALLHVDAAAGEWVTAVSWTARALLVLSTSVWVDATESMMAVTLSMLFKVLAAEVSLEKVGSADDVTEGTATDTDGCVTSGVVTGVTAGFGAAGAAAIDGRGADKRGAGPVSVVPSTDVSEGSGDVIVRIGTDIDARGAVKRES